MKRPYEKPVLKKLVTGLMNKYGRNPAYSRKVRKEIDGVPVWEPCWSRPHLDGISRYRYHKDEHGNRCRNDKPEPLHWGWLTIDRRLPG